MEREHFQVTVKLTNDEAPPGHRAVTRYLILRNVLLTEIDNIVENYRKEYWSTYDAEVTTYRKLTKTDFFEGQTLMR